MQALSRYLWGNHVAVSRIAVYRQRGRNLYAVKVRNKSDSLADGLSGIDPGRD
jgi:hypothetical protein